MKSPRLLCVKAECIGAEEVIELVDSRLVPVSYSPVLVPHCRSTRKDLLWVKAHSWRARDFVVPRTPWWGSRSYVALFCIQLGIHDMRMPAD